MITQELFESPILISALCSSSSSMRIHYSRVSACKDHAGIKQLRFRFTCIRYIVFPQEGHDQGNKFKLNLALAQSLILANRAYQITLNLVWAGSKQTKPKHNFGFSSTHGGHPNHRSRSVFNNRSARREFTKGYKSINLRPQVNAFANLPQQSNSQSTRRNPARITAVRAAAAEAMFIDQQEIITLDNHNLH